MSEITVITNNKPYRLQSFADLPLKVREDFDYVRKSDYDDERFVMYRGCWYDTKDVQGIIVKRDGETHPMGWAMVVDEDHPFAKWDSVSSDSFFSGVLFRMWDYDHVQCGTYTS